MLTNASTYGVFTARAFHSVILYGVSSATLRVVYTFCRRSAHVLHFIRVQRSPYDLLPFCAGIARDLTIWSENFYLETKSVSNLDLTIFLSFHSNFYDQSIIFFID